MRALRPVVTAVQFPSLRCVSFQDDSVRPDLPHLGTALPVLLFRLPLPVALPLVGSWIRMRNVFACVVAGQLQVCSTQPAWHCSSMSCGV